MCAGENRSERQVGRGSRDRVTIDLRGRGEELQALALARKLTTAALVRGALRALLDGEPTVGGNKIAATPAKPVVKVTLRLSAAHASALATRSRESDVSQGTYVAALMDGTPPSALAPDHAGAVAALIGSTDQLATMGADSNAFMRLLRRGSSSEVEKYRAGVMSLAADVRRHLAVASTLVAELQPARRSHRSRVLAPRGRKS